MQWLGSLAIVALCAGCWRDTPPASPQSSPEPPHAAADATAAAPTAPPFEVHVIAWRWTCEVDYPDGVTDTDLHLPVGRPVRMTVTSKDIEHEIVIASAHVDVRAEPKVTRTLDLRFDQPGHVVWTCPVDVPPGRPPETATHPLFIDTPAALAQYFAPFEADMHPKTRADFLALGRKLYENKGCNVCHTIDGSPRVGASLQGMFGSTIVLDDGTRRTMDEQAIRDALRTPTAFVRRAYPPSMPSYDGQLTSVQTDALVAFIESLAAAAQAPGAAPGTP